MKQYAKKNMLTFNSELAKSIGIKEAVVVGQVHFWTEQNRKKKQNLYDGHYWTYNTYDEWADQLICISRRSVVEAIKKLEELRILISGNYNKASYDRTKWYRIDYDVLETYIPKSSFNRDFLDDSSDIDLMEKMWNSTHWTPSETSHSAKSALTIPESNIYRENVAKSTGIPVEYLDGTFIAIPKSIPTTID